MRCNHSRFQTLYRIATRWRNGRRTPSRFARRDRSHYDTARSLRCEALEPRIVLNGGPVISEIMAINHATLADEDGDYSDWIEIYNPEPQAVDLSGWYLTDAADDMDKWAFPDVRIPANDYLVVFASGKDHTDPESELHTNFKLSGSGEYLALVEPGATIAHEYAPRYPAQTADISYGPQQVVDVHPFVTNPAAVTTLMPSSPSDDVATATWTAPGFDDSLWQPLTTGVGFDAGGQLAPLIDPAGDTSAMRGNTASAYLRSRFDIAGALPDLDQLMLDVHYDDGFVAYLNGTEVARSNAPAGPLSWQSTATGDHGGTLATIDYDNFSDATSRDDFSLVGSAAWFGSRLRLTPSSTSQAGAAWTSDPIPFGSDYSFSASMAIDVHSPGGASDADGRGADGMTFVLQGAGNHRLGGQGGALGLDGTGMAFVAVEFDTWASGSFDPDSSLPTHVGIDTSAAGNVARVAVARFNGGAQGTNIRYVWIDYDGTTDLMEVFFSATPTKPTASVLSATVDLAALYGGVTELYGGWTAATGGATNTHDVIQWEMTTGAGDLGLQGETFDISSHIGLLHSGENVLAIHGLNQTAADDDFLILPTLTGMQSLAVELDQPKFFSTPTPGGPNGVGTDSPAGHITYSVTSRTFATPFDLTLTASSPTATIRYTTDGAIPDATSTRYTGPLRIDASTRLRARAFEPDRAPGPVESESYILVDASLTNFRGTGRPFESNLPLMVFDSFGDSRVNREATRLVPVSGVFIDPGTDGRTVITDAPEFGGRTGMRIRGQSSQGWPKHQYAMEIWGEAHSDTGLIAASEAEDLAVSFFGLPAESDWVLNGPYSDKSQLNNYLSFQWSNAMGLYAPRARLVEVFVNADGGAVHYSTNYVGTYVLLEKIKIDDNRVDLAELSSAATGPPEITGGYLWKKDKPGAGDVPFTTSHGQQLRHVDPGDNEITAAQTAWLTGYINQFEAALYGPNFADPDLGYAQYIDVDSWIDTWILVEMTKNIDGFRLSTYYHKDRGGKIAQGPAWDYNLSLSNANYLKGAYPNGWYHDDLNNQDYPYWRRLFEDPHFVQRLTDRWQVLRQSVFSTPALLADIDAAVGLLTDGNPDPQVGDHFSPVGRNFTKWRNLDDYLWPNPFFGVGDSPPSPIGGRPSQYSDYIDIMKWFVENRVDWIDSRYVAMPTISVVDNEVTISASQGDIYYTVDGTDPRAGMDSAIQYTGPFGVTENAVIAARAYDTAHNIRETTPFSGLVTEPLVLEVPAVRVSEINYNPYRANPAAGLGELDVDKDQFEFIEVVNPSTTEAVNLVGVRFSRGIEFDFTGSEITQLAPGARALVVRNRAAFESRYGVGLPVAGEFDNQTRLSNSGELIRLEDAAGNVIQEFDYSDGGRWPGRADGKGATLEVVDLDGDYDTAENWRSSNEFNGTPGMAGSGPVFDVVVNEVLSHSDAEQLDKVELYNVTDQAIDLGGWHLSDTHDDYFRFTFDAGTVIEPGDYLVLDQSQLGFALDGQSSDDIWLLEGDLSQAGNPVRFADHFGFDATDTNVSLGRVPNGDPLAQGASLFPMTAQTFGEPNSDFVPGSLIVSEIHYHPAPLPAGQPPEMTGSDLEFVELYNSSGAALAIGGWQFEQTGGQTFELPAGTLLPAAALVVLVGFDPQSEPATAAAFRSIYGIDAAVTLIGPYDGKLDNSGEQLKLLRPEDPGDPATGFVLVDRVAYDDDAPWPVAADGAGASLTRTAAAAFGNFATSWQAADPTPGSASFGSGPLLGDVNRDNLVNGLDVDPFVATLLNGPFQAEADMNQDGVVNGLDVSPFVATVIGDGQATAVAALAVPPVTAARRTVQVAPPVAPPDAGTPDRTPADATNRGGVTMRSQYRRGSHGAQIEPAAHALRHPDRLSPRHRLRDHVAGKAATEQLTVEATWTDLADHALRHVSAWLQSL